MMRASNLIGIAGRAGAGKDLAYKLICDITGVDYMNKKFSQKIKSITSLVLGIREFELDLHDVKESALGPEWDNVYYQSSHCVPSRNGHRMPEELVSVREKLTPRKFMQLLGTEFGRNMIHKDIWVNALFEDFYGGPMDREGRIEYCESDLDLRYLEDDWSGVSDDQLERYMITSCDFDGKSVEDFMGSNWIVTDVRFQNEVARIRKEGGTVIKVVRPNNPEPLHSHASEAGVDKLDVDYVVEADDEESLRKELTKILKR